MPQTTSGHDLVTLAIELEQRVRLGSPDYSELLRRLVRIDSGPDTPEGAREVGRLVAERLEEAGFAFAGGGPGGLLVGTRPGEADGRVLLVAHTGTPWPAGTATNWPFSVFHGIASGPGVARSKAGLVAMIAAVEALDGAELESLAGMTVLLLPDGHGHDRLQEAIRSLAKAGTWALEFSSPQPDSPGRVSTATPLATLAGEVAEALDEELTAEPASAVPAAAVIDALGIPVLAAVGPPALSNETPAESIDMESFFRCAALAATLLAVYRPD